MATVFAVMNWITVIYAFILVVVLAVTLITVAVCLTSTARALHKIAGGLKVIERQTGPLGGHMDQLNTSLAGVSKELKGAAGNLTGADRLLASVMGEAAEASAERVA